MKRRLEKRGRRFTRGKRKRVETRSREKTSPEC